MSIACVMGGDRQYLRHGEQVVKVRECAATSRSLESDPEVFTFTSQSDAEHCQLDQEGEAPDGPEIVDVDRHAKKWGANRKSRVDVRSGQRIVELPVMLLVRLLVFEVGGLVLRRRGADFFFYVVAIDGVAALETDGSPAVL